MVKPYPNDHYLPEGDSPFKEEWLDPDSQFYDHNRKPRSKKINHGIKPDLMKATSRDIERIKKENYRKQ